MTGRDGQRNPVVSGRSEARRRPSPDKGSAGTGTLIACARRQRTSPARERGGLGARSVRRLASTGPDLLRRAGGASRLLPPGIPRPTSVAGRARIRRPRSPLPGPVTPVEQPAGHVDRDAPAGVLGGLLAWVGFTAPSAVALVAFALLTGSVDLSTAGWVSRLSWRPSRSSPRPSSSWLARSPRTGPAA